MTREKTTRNEIKINTIGKFTKSNKKLKKKKRALQKMASILNKAVKVAAKPPFVVLIITIDAL